MPISITPTETVPFSSSRELLHHVKRHLGEQGNALCNALEQVAGKPGRRKAFNLIADIAGARDWHSAFTGRLEELRELLLLEHFDRPDPDFEFDMRVLDPTSPVAEACIWQADRLEDLIDASAELSAAIAALPRTPANLIRRPMRT